MRPDNLLDLFEIDRAAGSHADGAPAMPLLGTAPVGVEFDNVAPLDPSRAIAEPPRPPSAGRRRTLPFGLSASLALHLLPLLLLLHWTTAPAEIAAPIPVQLVLEQPPPPPPPRPRPKEPKHRPPGRLASIDTGEPASQPEPPPPRAAAAQPAESGDRPITAAPLPEPHPSPELVPALPKPAPLPELAALLSVPKPPPYVEERKPQPVVARLPNPHPALRRTPFPGTAATRDEYLAYCAALIRRYFDMVPSSFIAGRRGETTLSLLVLDDGRIARIAVTRSSGYRDIDERVKRMVAAVHRFPPLPQWTQAPSIELTYVGSFAEGRLR